MVCTSIVLESRLRSLYSPLVWRATSFLLSFSKNTDFCNFKFLKMPYTNLEIIPMVIAFIIPPFPDFHQINLIKYTNLYKTYVRSLRFWKILSKQPNTHISVEYYLYLLHPSNIIWAGTTRLLFLSYLLIYELWLTIEVNVYFWLALFFRNLNLIPTGLQPSNSTIKMWVWENPLLKKNRW